MKFLRLAIKLIFSLTLASTLWGCGGSGGNTGVLTISPGGTTVVLRDSTLQYTASRSDVTWSVQGAGNGTISNSGLYTPPSTLPISLAPVVVQVNSSDGQTATAQVSLRAADNLAFGTPVKVNADPIDGSFFILEFFAGGISDQMAVKLGSVREDTAFAASSSAPPKPTPIPNVFYSQSLNFDPFSTPVNIGNVPSAFQIPTAVEIDSHENPGILFEQSNVNPLLDDNARSRMFFVGSRDQGFHFNAPVPIAPALLATNSQLFGTMQIDDQDRLHVAFLEVQPTPTPEVQTILSLQSIDGGSHWSNPVTVASLHGDTSSLNFLNLAISPEGEKLYVCWVDDSGNISLGISNDGGNSFGSPVPVTDSNDVFFFCRVALGPQGQVYVAYLTGGDIDHINVFLKVSTDGGASFGAPIPVSSKPTNASEGARFLLSVDDLGRIDIIWDAIPDNSTELTLMHARSLDGGAHFSANQTIVSSALGNSMGSAAPRSLRHDSIGRLYVQYFDLAGSANYNILTLIGE